MAFRESSDRSGMTPSRAGLAASLVLHSEAIAAAARVGLTRVGFVSDPNDKVN